MWKLASASSEYNKRSQGWGVQSREIHTGGRDAKKKDVVLKINMRSFQICCAAFMITLIGLLGVVFIVKSRAPRLPDSEDQVM